MSSNKTYLVTGANRGIGQGLVSTFLQRPSTTVVAGVRDPSKSSSVALASLPAAKGSRLILVKIDSSVESDPAAAVKQLQKEHGITSLDVVIANAGISHTVLPTIQSSFDAALDHFKVNSVAPLILLGATAPLLKQSKTGNPVYLAISTIIGSIGAQAGLSEQSIGDMNPYGASKAALNYNVHRLHYEEPWLTSFVVHPGLVETDMAAEITKRTGVDIKAQGAITVAQSVAGISDVIDKATREKTSGKFKSYDGTELPW